MKEDYLKTVENKEKSIYDLKEFVDLCNRSIKDNEDILIILNYSRKIELKWSLTLIKHKIKEDASQLKSKLEENNQQLKDTAKNI